MSGQVGKVIATELKDPKDIPAYEFPDSGHVRVAMTTSELAMLDTSSTEVTSRSTTSTTDSSNKRGEAIVKSRLITTTAVLISCGLFGVIVNVFAASSDKGGIRSTAVGIATLALALFVRDWYRLHGQKLSRRLTPLINASQLIVNWNFIPWFDMFVFDKQTIAGKYLFNAEGPIVNEEIPRTPNKSPPHSPKKNADTAAVSVEMKGP